MSNKVQLCAETVHGMLWLQTHFDNSEWEHLSSKQVMLTFDDAKSLAADARQAGVLVNQIPSISISRKY